MLDENNKLEIDPDEQKELWESYLQTIEVKKSDVGQRGSENN